MRIIFFTNRVSIGSGYFLEAVISSVPSETELYVVAGGKKVSPSAQLMSFFNSIVSFFNPKDHIKIARKTRSLKPLMVVDVAKKNNLPLFCLEQLDDEFYETCRAFEPDLILSCFNPLIFSEKFINLPKIACVNVHPSLLPKYGGRGIYFWPIRNGDTETGVTAHHIIPRVDAGDIIIQKAMPLPPDYTFADIVDAHIIATRDLIPEVIDLVKAGELPHIKQDLTQRTYVFEPKEEDLIVDWSKSVQDIDNLVRARPPRLRPRIASKISPLITSVKGRKIFIWDCEVKAIDKPQNSMEKPGEVLELSKQGIRVSVKNGYVLLKVLSSSKRSIIMPGWLFARLFRIRRGDIMGT